MRYQINSVYITAKNLPEALEYTGYYIRGLLDWREEYERGIWVGKEPKHPTIIELLF